MRVLGGDPGQWEAGDRHVVTVGVFDGVHRGHRHLIDRVREAAAGSGAAAGVVTFDRHPLEVLAPVRAPRILTSLDHRLELFAAAGVETVGVLPFEGRVQHLSPEEFAGVVLAEGMRARSVVTGEDFRFGRDREGDVDALRRLGGILGFEVEPLGLIDGPLSSTHIRGLVAAGEVAAAGAALGRLFELRGLVVRGRGMGGRIGVPTANLDVPAGMAVPGRGVYAVWAAAVGRRVPGVANVGVRPTFGGDREVVEAHLIGFDEDLYGESIGLAFTARIRPERRFDGPDELVAQIHRDIEAALDLLA